MNKLPRVEKINIYDYPINLADYGSYDEKGRFVIDRKILSQELIEKFNELVEVVNSLSERLEKEK